MFCVRTSKEALQLLAPVAAGGPVPYDIILKEHNPPEANACRLLRKMARADLLSLIPVVCKLARGGGGEGYGEMGVRLRHFV